MKPRKPLPRRSTRIKSKGKSRFPKRRDPKFIAWIKTQPCALLVVTPFAGHWCTGYVGRNPIEPAHIKTQGSGGDDLGNVIPLCPFAHDRQEGRTADFEKEYGIDLKALAAEYAQRYSESGETLGET